MGWKSRSLCAALSWAVGLTSALSTPVFSQTFAYDRIVNISNLGSGAVPAGGLARYALRPILDERLNLLAKYQYVYDMYGQEIDGAVTRGPRQRSHVASIDADYDLSTRWTLGGKVGMRLSEAAAVEEEEFAKNDALLTVVNARYHLVHNWDVLLEGRSLVAEQAGTADLGAVVGAYRQFGEKVMLGGSYNFGRFSDDLTDMVRDDKGAEINLIAKF
jgi:hypothetical protein